MHNTEVLGERICDLAAHLSAATCRLLTLIAEFDDEEGWSRDGCRSCADWLNWKCGIGLNAAREKVRVAQALKGLPRIHEAFSKGAISYSKTRAMTRVATADNESYLMMIAEHGTAAHVESVVRGYRQARASVTREQANDRHARRALGWRFEDDGSFVFTCRLDPEEGVKLVEALEKRREELSRQQDTENDVNAQTPYAAFRADALVDLVTRATDTELVVHVAAETLRGDDDDGRCHVEPDPELAPETARRLACDGGVVRLVEDARGQPLDVGRKTRSISPALKRALNARDRGCRFPGCSMTRHLLGHHIEHWANGGRTSLENLVRVCWHHHRMLHEGGFTVEHRKDGRLVFRRPDAGVLNEQTAHSYTRRCPEALLRSTNAALGLAIDHTTGVCRWDGLPMDRAMAVEGLLAASRELDWEQALPR